MVYADSCMDSFFQWQTFCVNLAEMKKTSPGARLPCLPNKTVPAGPWPKTTPDVVSGGFGVQIVSVVSWLKTENSTFPVKKAIRITDPKHFFRNIMQCL